MAWTTPKTWASEPLTSTGLNTYVRDNQTYLKDRVDAAAAQYIRTSGNYTTTSNGTLVDVDAVNMELTITTTGKDVLITLVGFGSIASNGRTLTIAVDINGTPYTMVEAHNEGSGKRNISFSYPFTGLLAGEHVFKLQWHGSSTSKVGATLLMAAPERNSRIP